MIVIFKKEGRKEGKRQGEKEKRKKRRAINGESCAVKLLPLPCL